MFQFSSVQLLSHVRLFATPWTAAHQASRPSLTPRACSNSCLSSQWCHPTISPSAAPFSPLPLIFPSIRVFSNESVLCIRRTDSLHGPQPCLTQWNCEPCCVGPPKMNGSWWRVLQNVVHWRRVWQTTSVFLSWEPHEQYENAKRYDTEEKT